MNNPIKQTFAAVLLFSSTALFHAGAFAAENPGTYGSRSAGFHLNELGIGSGYVGGTLKNHAEDLSVYPAFVRLGFSLNSLFGIESSSSRAQFILEPFYNTIDSPLSGYETGCSIGLRYLHELAGPVGIYFEGSFAPMYLSIDTKEQGAGGFNFLDQLGTGLQFKISVDNAVFAGYRFRHISHAGLVDRSNSGINSNAFIVGFSWLF
ncbi:MAG: acyloxyacyl hydrolase [Chlorobiaceae bacterium]|nr:acyloxyacyl hydrolase [Chlorobiaceae bacterium]